MTSSGRGCGKLYLTGEYAVMDPRGIAVIAGVNRYVTATATQVGDPNRDAGPSRGRVYSKYYPPAGRELVVAGNRAHLVGEQDIVAHAIAACYELAAAGKFGAGAGELMAVDVEISSQLDDAHSGQKYGLGSSGAVAVAVVRAVSAELGVDLGAEHIFKVAVIASLRAGAAGSFGDIACSSFGGVVLYRRPEPATLAQLLDQELVEAVAAPWPNLMVESRPDLGGLELLVGWTGTPVKTDVQLAAAGAAAATVGPGAPLSMAAQDFVTEVSVLSRQLWQAFSDSDEAAALAALAANRKLLAQFAAARGMVIETPLLADLVAVAVSAGAGAKSSGSGGGDCGIALAGAGVNREHIFAGWREVGVQPLEVDLAVNFR